MTKQVPFTLELLRDLYRHMEWADALVWQRTVTLPPDPVDERLRDRLLHLHVVQRAFLHVWTDRSVLFPPATDFATLATLLMWARPYYDEIRPFLETFHEARLAEPLAMPWAKYFEERLGRGFEHPSVADTMFQVVSHSTYHRGQVNTRLRELGAEPPLVDYIVWVWMGRPAAEWQAV